MTASFFPALDAANYQRHALHAPERAWPETNCYVDLWIELLHNFGLPPEAMLGFTLTQDFEGDHFTFFKPPLEDLETLFDLRVSELAIYDNLADHVVGQLQRHRLSIVEVDGFYLPDTRGVSYRTTHPKTSIAINHLDIAGKRMDYFHNAGYFSLDGEDFDGVFGLLPHQQSQEAVLFPYVEFIKAPQHPVCRLDNVVALTQRHLARAPQANPLATYAVEFPAHAERMLERPVEFFHLYAFNMQRQLGANFELLAAHLAFLDTQGVTMPAGALDAALAIANSAKTMQFQMARGLARRNFSTAQAYIQPMADHYDALMTHLRAALGGSAAPVRLITDAPHLAPATP